ncbi:hypothetical protein GDO81_008972 [Engystomops pustulosus]|uniref:Olfactory receptor n=1 Tax=Engystomops pustulosus TaxID=76066 RepID=A0AAV7BN78_ENGPU|nr:hypothetical protein GDO81_008972 [Engystomops pustulosus]
MGRLSKHDLYLVDFSMSSLAQHALTLGIGIIYLTTLLGNLTIIFLVCFVQKLHTPMYFFLCNLAIIDVTSISNIVPKLLFITITQDHRIGFSCCMMQLFFFVLCADAEIFMLTSMAYDRYVAVCKPLHYYTIMRKNVYIVMAASCWILGALNSLLHTLLTSVLQFCNSSDINNFFCDLNLLLDLSTTDTKKLKIFVFLEICFIILAQLTLTISIIIFSVILNIRSSSGRMKAFSSCTSHLITVILFYGPSIILYTKTESEDSKEQDMLLSMLYLFVVPMMNPLVYSLRNKDIWKAIDVLINKTILGGCCQVVMDH